MRRKWYMSPLFLTLVQQAFRYYQRRKARGTTVQHGRFSRVSGFSGRGSAPTARRRPF